MEPNKFEENIRTKLEERELQPSAEAWGKLEAQLGTPRSSNKTFWYAIAASLVAMLVVASFLLKEDTAVSNEIVEQPIPSETLKDVEVATSEENNPKDTPVTEEKTDAEITKSPPEQLPKKNEVIVANSSGKEETTREDRKEKTVETPVTAIAQAATKTKEVKTIEKIQKEDFINLKVDEVVAKVEDLQTTNRDVTAQDVEALLQKAQRDIATQRLLEESTTTIDPASLLNDVENELERSFRDKVFDALGEGFNKIRTAVVERNN